VDLVMGQPRSTPDGWKAPLSGIGTTSTTTSTAHLADAGRDVDSRCGPGKYQPRSARNNLDWSILFRNSAFTAQPTTAEEGFDHFYSPDATHWYIVSKDGMGDGLNMEDEVVFSAISVCSGVRRA